MSDESKCTTALEAEPVSAPTPIPLWLVMVLALLLLWGAVTFDRHGGWFEAKVYQPYRSVGQLAFYQPQKSDDPTVRGKVVFDNTCLLCHGADGQGKPGQFPPLAGSEWVNAKGANRLIRIPLVGLSGPIKVSGHDWSLAMPAMGASLSDSDLAAALSYIRNVWGNKAPFVTPEQVKAIRAELGNRSQPETVDELMKLPE